jgi:hypothetical protein
MARSCHETGSSAQRGRKDRKALYTTILNYRKKRVRGEADYIQVVARCAAMRWWQRDDGIMAVVRVIDAIVLRLNLNTIRLRELWACR